MPRALGRWRAVSYVSYSGPESSKERIARGTVSQVGLPFCAGDRTQSGVGYCDSVAQKWVPARQKTG